MEENLKRFIAASRIYVKEFILNKDNELQIKTIVNYFLQKNRKKSLILIGKPGTGKDLIMKICNKAFASFATNLCTDIVAEYNGAGEEGINRYKERERCFSDLGTEKNGKYYGNEINVFEHLIYNRYNQYQNIGLLTHFTTNLTPDQIKAKYGERAHDRLKEMCIVVNFNGDSFRGKAENVAQKPIILQEKELTQEEKDEIVQREMDKCIEFFRSTRRMNSTTTFFYYDYLTRKGLLNLADEDKTKYYNDALEIIKDEIGKEKLKAESNLDRKEARRINSIIINFSDSNKDIKARAIIKVKELAFEDYVRNECM